MQSRKARYRRKPITISRLFEYLFGSLRLKESLSVRKKRQFVRPHQMPKTSRYRTRRRRLRLRLRRKLQWIKYSKRIGYTLLGVTLTLCVAFWAKFAIVYHVPSFMQTGRLQGAVAYLVYKSWWFGPPRFDLAQYTNINPENPLQSLVLQLQRYQDIVTNPSEILYVWTR